MKASAAPLPKLGAIKIRVDRVYGNLVTYPVCERAKLIAELAGTKTLTHASLCLAERLGFEIVNVASPVLPAAMPWGPAWYER